MDSLNQLRAPLAHQEKRFSARLRARARPQSTPTPEIRTSKSGRTRRKRAIRANEALTHQDHSAAADEASANTTIQSIPNGPPEAAQQASTVTLAKFKLCIGADFGDSDSHLNVTTEKTDNSLLSAVAISYTWGEFNREPRIIGHWQGCPKSKAYIVLGSEWSITSFKKRLAQLTEKHGECWIDQFCFPQDEKKVRGAYLTISSISETYPVIALFPGSLCKYLPRALGEYRAAILASQEHPTTPSKDINSLEHGFRVELVGIQCLNSNGCCSWDSRVWTLLESTQATSLSILYVDDGEAPCFLYEDADSELPNSIPTSKTNTMSWLLAKA